MLSLVLSMPGSGMTWSATIAPQGQGDARILQIDIWLSGYQERAAMLVVKRK